MIDVDSLARLIQSRAASTNRYLVAIAGAPGSGKSTLAEHLRAALEHNGKAAVVVPMDGFHFDDAVLDARGQRSRKGAAFTFDARGFEVLLQRIRQGESEIAIPIFDRTMELSRAAAAIVDEGAEIVLVEGNYLLLTRLPWSRLRNLFDLAIFLNVPKEELERRLIRRWLDLGFDMTYAENWVASNDAPNILDVIENSSTADLVI